MTHTLRTACGITAAILALSGPGSPLSAQQRDTSLARAGSVARTAAETYNAPLTRRVSGAFDLPADQLIDGNVSVLNGPATIAGHIRGTLVAINADVRLAPGARIQQDLIVIGGAVSGQDSARIGGEVRVQPELLRYHFDGERLVLDGEPQFDDAWWMRHQVRHEFRRGEAYTDFFYLASRAYNRVEGLSFVLGPRFQRLTAWGKINVEAFSVIRTASPMRWGDETLGHDAKLELQFGRPIGVSVGARALDLVEPTESWEMGNGEIGLASFVLHRDFRDYYGRHGGELFLGLHGSEDADLTFSFSDEHWLDRRDRDPWSVFRDNDPWRPNPVMDAGTMHVLKSRLRLDTRERDVARWSGWYLVAEVEKGAGRITRSGAPVMTLGSFAPPSPEHADYTRGFLDVRRYNRISPDASLNLRIVADGWLSGDPLPTQRRLALGGPGTLPGYGFRGTSPTPDFLQCSAGMVQAGTPGQCERVALAQIELRSRFLAGVLRDDGPDDWWRPGFNHRAQWVLFADAGRGWRLGAEGDGTRYPAGRLPPLSTFKTDVGIGLDFGGLGIYWAKAVRDAGEPVRFFVRLEQRF